MPTLQPAAHVCHVNTQHDPGLHVLYLNIPVGKSCRSGRRPAGHSSRASVAVYVPRREKLTFRMCVRITRHRNEIWVTCTSAGRAKHVVDLEITSARVGAHDAGAGRAADAPREITRRRARIQRDHD